MSARRSKAANTKSAAKKKKKAPERPERQPPLTDLRVLIPELFMRQFSESGGQTDVNAFVGHQLAALRQLALFGSTVTGNTKLRLVGGMAAALAHLLSTPNEAPDDLVNALNRYCKASNMPWDSVPTASSVHADAKEDLLTFAQWVLIRGYATASADDRDAWAGDWVRRARNCALPEPWVQETKTLYRNLLDRMASADVATARAYDLIFLVFGVHAPWALNGDDVRPMAGRVKAKLKDAEKRARGYGRDMTAIDVAKAFMRGAGVRANVVEQLYAYLARRAERADP